jgi:hypothetical protein
MINEVKRIAIQQGEIMPNANLNIDELKAACDNADAHGVWLQIDELAELIRLACENASLKADIDKLHQAANEMVRENKIVQELLRIERQKNDKLVSALVRIHALLDSNDIDVEGKTMRFVNPMAAEVLHELSNRIRAIPYELPTYAKATELATVRQQLEDARKDSERSHSR